MRAMTVDPRGQVERPMTIGEAARRSGFSVPALRFCERRGLVAPSGRRPSGYRLYREVDLHRLAFIRQAKALGLTLNAIRQLVVATTTRNGVGTREQLLRMLAERISQTADQIAALTDLRKELARRRRALARGAQRDRGRGYCACLDTTRGR